MWSLMGFVSWIWWIWDCFLLWIWGLCLRKSCWWLVVGIGEMWFWKGVFWFLVLVGSMCLMFLLWMFCKFKCRERMRWCLNFMLMIWWVWVRRIFWWNWVFIYLLWILFILEMKSVYLCRFFGRRYYLWEMLGFLV